jgi:ribosome biogenesis GTPase / thiamine phosphate phosphatase
MSGNRKKEARQKNITADFLSGNLDEDRIDAGQRFSDRSAGAQRRKMVKTSLLRAAEQVPDAPIDGLPTGQVVQVYSLFYNVAREGRLYLCVLRKTLSKLRETRVIAGDFVRFRETGAVDESGRPEGVIEEVMERTTVLTRCNSVNPADQDPIVANAQQMLIVASLLEPPVKWGLVDRMIVAAQGGRLAPIVCLNKVDLRLSSASAEDDYQAAQHALRHYQSLGIAAMQTSAIGRVGIDELRETLRGKDTVLAGHSGVGKSSLIRAAQPELEIRIRAISAFTGKGTHTTTSSRFYDLDLGGRVIDTPGVKVFGMWGITAENLIEHFPDVAQKTAPPWRVENYGRILESLGTQGTR